MSDIQKELDEIAEKFNLNEDEKTLVLLLSVYKIDLSDMRGHMDEFTFHKVMRGFKKDISKKILLDHMLKVRQEFL